MRQATHTLGGLVYRSANWRDWADTLVKSLYAIMYRFGISVEQMVSWINQVAKKFKGAALDPSTIPDEVLSLLANAAAGVDIPLGDFFNHAIKRLLEDPPPGYRLQKDDLGQTYVKRQKRGPKSKERPLTKGAKFRGKVFVGVWWYTDAAKTSATAKLRNKLKSLGGGVFYKKPAGVGFTEYFGYAILPKGEVTSSGVDLRWLGEDLKAEDGDRDYRLSAAKLDSLAEGEPVKSSDTFTAPQLFKSEKFNWELNLVDVLNGRSKDPALNAAVKQLLSGYQK